MFIKYNPKLKEVARKLRNNPTSSEIIMWKFLSTYYKNYRFVRQKPLDNFIPDFYCAKLNLIIEIDGSIHENQEDKDFERDELFLSKYNIRTLRFKSSEVESNLEPIKRILDSVVG